MAQRPKGPGRPTSGRSHRQPPPQVKKPFPWGVALTSVVLGAFLVSILVYAVKNQGSGFETPLKLADKKTHAKVYEKLKSNHVPGPVKYDQAPPVGGPHNPIPQTCQVYSDPIANEHAVHSLEHGAVWITYRPGLSPADITVLRDLAREMPTYRLVSPYPGLKTVVSAQAWGRQMFFDSVKDSKLVDFVESYTDGPQAPEKGSACQGTTQTGPLTTSDTATPAPTTSPAASAPVAPSSPAAQPSSSAS